MFADIYLVAIYPDKNIVSKITKCLMWLKDDNENTFFVEWSFEEFKNRFSEVSNIENIEFHDFSLDNLVISNLLQLNQDNSKIMGGNLFVYGYINHCYVVIDAYNRKTLVLNRLELFNYDFDLFANVTFKWNKIYSKDCYIKNLLCSNESYFYKMSLPKQTFTKAQLKSRGWTEKSISNLLPEPFISNGSSIELWFFGDVEQAELDTQFKLQSERKMKSKEKRLNNAENIIDTYPVIVFPISEQELQLQTEKYILEKYTDCECLDFENVEIEYILDNLSNYQEFLLKLKGKITSELAISKIKPKFLEVISKIYPFLVN